MIAGGNLMDHVKVAVVGVGKFGRQHARVYRNLSGAELVGVYDPDEGRAAEVASQFGCRRFAIAAYRRPR